MEFDTKTISILELDSCQGEKWEISNSISHRLPWTEMRFSSCMHLKWSCSIFKVQCKKVRKLCLKISFWSAGASLILWQPVIDLQRVFFFSTLPHVWGKSLSLCNRGLKFTLTNIPWWNSSYAFFFSERILIKSASQLFVVFKWYSIAVIGDGVSAINHHCRLWGPLKN